MTIATKADASLNRQSDPASPWWHIDPSVLVAASALGIIGLFGIYSATRGRDADNYITFFVERQAMFLAAGLVLAVLMVFIDYRALKALAPPLYLSTLGTLFLVRVMGIEVKGAVSWFEIAGMRIQPSEFAKISLIITMAAVLSRRKEGPMSVQELIQVIIIAMMPFGLVLLQPDLGTAMVFVVVTAALLMVARAESHHLIVLVIMTAISFVLVFNSDQLRAHQRERIVAFLDPSVPWAWNQNQAQIAIGNGGVTGAGFGQGTQTRSGLVPEQRTDFIFTVIAEEFGFIGGTVVLLLFAFLLWRLYRMAKLAGDNFGAYIVVGVLAMFAFQMFQSIGMTMGIMPITGVPLPFVSAGGSSALSSFLALGLAINVHMRRFGAAIDEEVGTPTSIR